MLFPREPYRDLEPTPALRYLTYRMYNTREPETDDVEEHVATEVVLR